MFLSKLSIARPVTVTMLILVFVIFGGMAYFQLPLNMVPDMSLPFVTIQTIYPGAGPSEVELQVTKRIEDAISTISHINYIESYSMDNVSFVLINFNEAKSVDIALQEVKEKVDAIVNNLPADAHLPIIGKFDMSAAPVVRMVLSGTQSATELFQYADQVLQDRFAQIPGVAQVTVSGGQEREIQVVLNERSVFSNNISLPGLSQIIAAQNMNLPAGTFSVGNQELSVKIEGEIRDMNTLRNLEIPTAFGNRRLSQIADVRDTGAEVRERTTFFDISNNIKHENVVSMSLIKSADGNPVEISRQLHRILPGIVASLPLEMDLTIVSDDSGFIQAAVDDTLANILLGIIFTALMLLFFLFDYRSAIIVAITMPLSMVSTFILMQFAGFSLNILSLMGLSASVGVLVTNSVIILENIFRYKDMGYGKKEAADKGTAEVTIAVIAATFTNLVVFIPIGTMSGVIGSFFTEFALTVAFATLFSLLIGFTITPMLASKMLPEKPKPNKVAKSIDSWFKWLERQYKGVLIKLMRRKKVSTAFLGFIVLLFVFSLWVATQIGFEFAPNMDQGSIDVTVELPIGYNLEETTNTMNTIESILASYSEIEYILTTLGAAGRRDRGMNLAGMNITLVDQSERDVSTQQVVDRMMKDLAHIPNAKIIISAASGMGGGGGAAVSLYILGQEDDRLVELSNEVMDKIRDIPGLVNLDTSVRSGRPELTVRPRRDQLALTGNTVMELAIGVRAAIDGLVATQFSEGGNEYDIRITMDEEAYNSPEKLRNLTIITSRGRFQLGQLADVYFTEGVNQIIRRNKTKTITISGDPASGIPLGTITSEIERRLAEIDFPEGYSFEWAGSAEMMQEAMQQMLRAGLLAFLLLFMLLAAILESFRQPLLILSTIPLTFIGIFFVQYLSGMTMNIMSMMAMIMLMGIVVTNAILILDYANMRIKEGLTVKEALLEACPIKLKPILMLNLAIILGMLPMALGIGGSGKEFRQAMGIVSIGGLIMATVLSFFVIPALFYITTKSVNKKYAKPKI